MKFNSWRESSANGRRPVPAGEPKKGVACMARRRTFDTDMMAALAIRQARDNGFYRD
jgi:hypothetical protein